MVNVNLKEYEVVYLWDKDGCNKKTAERFVKDVEEKAGIALPVASSEETHASKKLFIGANVPGAGETKGMNVTLKVFPDGFAISGGGLLSAFMGAVKFAAENVSDEGIASFEETTYSLEKVTCEPLSEGAEFRVMSYNIMAEWPNWGGLYMPISQRNEGFHSVIDAYDPDVIGIQEVSDTWSELIPKEYGHIYEFVNRRTPDDKFYNLSTIMYKKEKFELIKSGLQYFAYNGPNKIRLVDWAILKDKATEKKFAFFNTHWCFYKEAVQDAERIWNARENAVIIRSVMAANPDVKHAFSTADYNTLAEHPIAVEFRKYAELVDSMELARDAGNPYDIVGGCSHPGTNREGFTAGGRIDNIYVTPNMKVHCYHTILWNGVEHVSDHSPKYADFTLE